MVRIDDSSNGAGYRVAPDAPYFRGRSEGVRLRGASAWPSGRSGNHPRDRAESPDWLAHGTSLGAVIQLEGDHGSSNTSCQFRASKGYIRHITMGFTRASLDLRRELIKMTPWLPERRSGWRRGV